MADIRSVFLMHVNWIRQEELFFILQGLIASPIKIEQVAVGVEHAAIRVCQMRVLLHCLDHMRQECWVFLLEQVQSDAQALNENVQLTCCQLAILLLRL